MYNAYKIRFINEPSNGQIVQKNTWLFKDTQKSPDLFGNKRNYSPNDLSYEADLLFRELAGGLRESIQYIALDSSEYESPPEVINLSVTEDASALEP